MADGGFVGLSSEEAKRRLAADGPNALPGSEPKSLFRIVREEVMM